MFKNFRWDKTASDRELIVWVLLLALVLWLGARRFYVPATQSLKNIQAQIEAKKMEIEIHRKLMKNKVLASFSSGGGDSGRQALSQKVRDAFTKSNMASDVVVSELLTELTNPRFAQAAMLEKFNFTGEKKQSGFSEMNLDMKLVGTYEGIARYLSLIRDLPYLLKMNSLVLKPMDPQSPGKIELAAKGILYVGDPKALGGSPRFSRSDTALDLLVERNANKTYSPFAAKTREMSAWSLHELKLSATMAGSLHPTALINGRLFELGEEIAEFKLVEIHPRDVVLQRGEIRHVLKISDTLGGERGEEEAGHELKPLSEIRPLPLKESSAPLEEKTEAPVPDMGQEVGGPSGSGEANAPAEGAAEDLDRYKRNDYGLLSEEKQNSPSENSGAQNPTPPSEAGGGNTSKLNPNEVEDIERVPFADLEAPALVSALEF